MVPLSQVVEVDRTREAFALEVLGGMARPLAVVARTQGGDSVPADQSESALLSVGAEK